MGRSQDHLKRLKAQKRADFGQGAGVRRAALLALAVLVVGLSTSGSWLAVQHLAHGSGAAHGLMARAERWLLDRRQADLEPVRPDGAPVSFVIADGEQLEQVADRLAAQGLIRDADAFLLLARVRGLDRSVQAGRHTLKPGMTAAQVLDALQVAPADSVTITVLEGLRAEETAALLGGNGLVDREAFLAAVRSTAPTGRPTVDQRPSGSDLEGYLFPDTYDIARSASAGDVVGLLLDNFEARVASLVPAAGAAGLSVQEVVILASIVEKEAALDAERPKIARVYLNRLDTAPYLLNADPTVQYALGFQPDSGSWWKRPLLEADLAVDSPYNTYTQAGLPPGPIDSPGLASIEAVLAPADGDWQYFVADTEACDGSHLFANTYEEHLANVARARAATCGQ